MIIPAIAPHAPYTVSEDHLKAVRAFSDRTGAPIVTHISETKSEVDESVKNKGATPVAYLERIGFLNEQGHCRPHGLAAGRRYRGSSNVAVSVWFTIRSQT